MRNSLARNLGALGGAVSVLAVFSTALALRTDLLPVLEGRFPVTLVIGVVAAVLAATSSLFIMQTKRRALGNKQVFIVYSRKDREVAERIFDLLAASGFSPWLDVRSLRPGDIWRSRVLRAIDDSALALVLVSGNLTTDTFAGQELKAVLATLPQRDATESAVIPVRLEDVPLPSEVAHIQAFDFFSGGDPERFLEALAYRLR